MINQKNKNKDRQFCIGASDTQFVMGNWKTATFMNWWQTKLGVKENNFTNIYLLTGTSKEHQIADWYAKKYNKKLVLDRRVKVRKYKLVVNLDAETKRSIIEIKTFKIDKKKWEIPKKYIEQVQVQMFATKKRKAKIIAYGLLEEDYNNFFLPIDETRIIKTPIYYNAQWINNEYLPRLKYLCWCLKKKKTPNIEEYEKRK